MQKQKNIFWDVDGVFADLNFAYFQFLTNHPKWKDKYKDLKWADLDKVLPINPKYGSLELKTHTEFGEELDKDFTSSLDFFNHRPLYAGAVEAIKKLHKLGYRQFTMSATFNVEVKTKLLNHLLADVLDYITIECVEHGKFMHDTAKEDMLKSCYEKYSLAPQETVLIDDRIYNLEAAINTGANPIRWRCEFTSELPEEMNWIPEFSDYNKLIEFLENLK